VRGLKEAGNPFAGQYSEFDRWAFAHYVDPNSKKFQQVFMSDDEPTMDFFYVNVDENGYVVPMATQLEWMLNPPADLEENPCQYSFYCAGELDPQLKAWLRETGLMQMARGAPPVPRWLAENPPRWVSPVAGGEYLTLGRLGSGTGLEADLSIEQMYNLMPHVEDPAGSDKYCRYSGDGKLIAEAGQDQEWWQLFFSNFDQVAGELSNGLGYKVREYRGTIVVYEKTSWAVLGTFDFQGNKLEIGDEKYGSQYLLRWIYGGNLKPVYERQQASGNQQDTTLFDVTPS